MVRSRNQEVDMARYRNQLPLCEYSGGQGVHVTNRYAELTDDQLVALEESLYDDECDGRDTWAERDQVLWEMNRRGLMDRKAS